MTAPDAPPVEPLRLTLEEALRLLAEKRGTTLAYHVGDGSPDDPSGWVEAETGTLLGDYGRWEDAASFGLGVPVERRDDTAGLVAAVESGLHYIKWAEEHGHMGAPSSRTLIEAVLARVRSER